MIPVVGKNKNQMHQTVVTRNVVQLDSSKPLCFEHVFSLPRSAWIKDFLGNGETVKHGSAHQIPNKTTTRYTSNHRILSLRDKFHFDLILNTPCFGFFRVNPAERFDDLIDAVGALCDLPLHMI